MSEYVPGADPLVEGVIAELKLQRFGLYMLAQFASYYGIDEATAKRWKKKGLIRGTPHGPKGIRLPGWLIAKYIAYGVQEKWDGTERRKNSRSGSGSLDQSLAPVTGTAAGTTAGPDKQLVSRLASKI